MAFKLGTERGNYAVSGEIKTKMRFHREAGGDASVPGTPVLRKNLKGGVMGEANNDGSIFISDKIEEGSSEERQVLAHEMKHMTAMKLGKLAYDDNYIKWNGESFPRKNGKILFEGKWIPEGDRNFPWEHRH